jgi:large subunit ribosomal protein LX
MAMKAFRVSGKFQMGYKEMAFVKEFALTDRAKAEDRLYAELGSKHGVPRRLIAIEKVEEIPLDQVQDGSVRQRLGGK